MSEKLSEAIDLLKRVNEILNDVYDDALGLGKEEPDKEEPKNKKVTLTIKVKNPYDGIEIREEDLEEIRKDLEEIINDFTRE